ncbi:hypothetical protein [Amaricoccus sp.]|uniref:hypothetical protein n=1 Tax=Amaricoccus sp. TaxID=1872485 RepID=UPI001B5A94DF|nr:hypothetical protein [Amaricoccus sp.]MBP7242313.1 hypothetical protein [Amaricoccus sp.]
MRIHEIAGAAMVSALVLAGSAGAEEQILKFRLVTTDRDSVEHDVANVPGRYVAAHESVGVAVFEDGRIAHKSFVYTENGTEDAGEAVGYSTYTFENGDALTAKFVSTWGADGFKGTYEVLSGAGEFEGATGTGTFGKVDVPWRDMSAYEGSFTLEVPGA